MTDLPDYPARNQDPWDTTLHARINAVQARADVTADILATVKDIGGNVDIPFGSVLVTHSPDGSAWRWDTNNDGTVTRTKVTPSTPLPGDPGDTGGGTNPPNDDPTTLTIGAHTHDIDGTNVYRDVDFLVRYLWSATQTTPPTNQYGVDVVVNKTTNVVVSVSNRLSGSSQAAPAFTSGQYVLSGHGLGSGTAGQFLLDYATVGATMALSGDGGAATGGGTGTPVPTPVTGAIFAYWYQVYRPPKINAINSTAMSHVNQINIALAQSGQAGTGKLYLPIPNSTNSTTRAEVTTQVNAWRAADKNVLMTIGGSSDGGITITNTTQAQQTFDDLVALNEGTNPINFNGLDIDLEPSGSSWTQAPLIALITKCKQHWGPNFLIQLTPGLYGGYIPLWQNLIRALLSLGYLDFVSAMMYDNIESTTYNGQVSQIQGVVSNLRAAGLPDSKIMLAYMLLPYSGYKASSLSVIQSTWAWARTTYPLINKFILWEHSIDADNSYVVANGSVPTSIGL